MLFLIKVPCILVKELLSFRGMSKLLFSFINTNPRIESKYEEYCEKELNWVFKAQE